MTTNLPHDFSARSANFTWHDVLCAGSLDAVIKMAKARGFEAHIYEGANLIGEWSPLYGFRRLY
jgi:hypothetical protein